MMNLYHWRGQNQDQTSLGLFTTRSAARFGSEPTGFQSPTTLNWIRGKTRTRIIRPAGSSTCGSTIQPRVTGSTHGYHLSNNVQAR